MFSLILAVVGIALVIVLVTMTSYYGGNTLDKGQDSAEVARAVNELVQIKTAATNFYMDTGAHPESLQSLMPKYMHSMPNGWGVEVPGGYAFESTKLLSGTEERKLEMCKEVNQRLGISGDPPSCSSIPSTFSGCCVAS